MVAAGLMLLGLVSGPPAEAQGAPAEPDEAESRSEPEPETTPEFVAPVLTHFEDAVYPEGVSAEGDVEVLLLVQIETDGSVSAAEVLSSGGPEFDDAAVAAAREFRFEPARENGAPIAVQIEYRYVFTAPAAVVEAPPSAPEPVDPTTPPEPAIPEPVDPTPRGPEPLVIDDTEVVRAPPIVKEAAQASVDAEQAERVAGTQGDSIKAAQTLAGVARPSANAGELVVWGASPADTRLYVDWIPVPRLFHLGGGRSIAPTPFVDSVAVVPGGFGVAYGRAIGGLVRVDSVSPRSLAARRRWGAFARAETIDVGAGADTRITDRGWTAVAVRRSLLAETYGQVLPESTREVVPIPTYWDYQAKAHIVVGRTDTIELLAFGSHDRVSRGIPSLTPDQAFSESQTLGQHRFGARLTRARPTGSTMRIAAWVGLDDDDVVQSFAQARAAATSRAWRSGIRVSERRRVARFLVVDMGIDLELTHTDAEREGAITLPAREGDVRVFGQPPGDRVAADEWETYQGAVAAYGSLLFEFGKGRWTIEPGLRFEPLITSVDRIMPVRPIEPEVGRIDAELAVDPRLKAAWRPVQWLAIYAAGGRFHQAAAAADFSPVFGNPRLGAAEAYHSLGGVKITPRPWVALDVTGFWIRSRSLAVRSDDPTPPVAAVLADEGDGRSVGGQLAARFRPAKDVFAWLTYSLMRADRRRDGSAPWRPFDFDQTHVLQALASWRHRTGVELGGRVDLTSGNPRTEVIDAVENARTGEFDPIFGRHNRTRLPLFLRLSARLGWGRQWDWGQLRTWLDVQNVTNRDNAEELFYTSDFSQRGFVRGLPVLPSLGLEVRL